MEGGRPRRPLVIGIAVAALIAGGVLAILLTGGDDGDEKSASSPATATETTATTETEKTATERTETDSGPSAREQRDTAMVESTVTSFVEAAETSDPAACDQVAGGAGKGLEQCAEAVGIDLRRLPSSDELDLSSVKVSGTQAEAKLSNGSSFSLRQSGGKWQITGFEPGPAPGG